MMPLREMYPQRQPGQPLKLVVLSRKSGAPEGWGVEGQDSPVE